MSLFVTTRGSGAHHFVALHGWGADHRAFAPVVRRMPADVTLHLIDQPGCGESLPPDVWTVDGIAEPIVRYIDSLPAERITIAGACSGAVVGMFAALARQNRLERLVLIDPFLEAPWYFALFTWPIVGRLFYRSSFGNDLGRRITNSFVRQNRRSDMTGGFARVQHDRALRYLRALVRAERPAADALQQLDGRVDIAVGQNTFRVVRRSVAEFVELYWPSTAVTVIDGAGHLPLLEAPRAVADRVLWSTNQRQRRAS